MSSGDVVGTYRPNRRTGTFSVIIPPGSKYHFSYLQGGNEISSEEVFVPADITYQEIQKEITLKPINICPGMEITKDTANILLNVLVLNNRKAQKPVANAEVRLQSKGMTDIVVKTDENGRTSTIKLAPEKSYELKASGEGKASDISVFNTIGIKNTKLLDKTLYLEKAGKYALLMNVVIKASKAGKTVAGANVKVTGTDGSVWEGVTDENGKLSGVILQPSTNYQVEAEKDGIVAARGTVSTQGIRGSKTIEKILYMKGGRSEVPDNSEVSGNCFTFYFKYNMNEVDEMAPEYKQFIDKLVELKNSGAKVTLQVEACASTVPTKKFKNNKELAALRAEETAGKLKASLKQKGVNESDVVIASQKARVGGPSYAGDYNNEEKYGKYQFVKVCVIK